jgi:hypothetical protein
MHEDPARRASAAVLVSGDCRSPSWHCPFLASPLKTTNSLSFVFSFPVLQVHHETRFLDHDQGSVPFFTVMKL